MHTNCLDYHHHHPANDNDNDNAAHDANQNATYSPRTGPNAQIC